MPRLTKRLCEQLAADRPAGIVWDDQVKGFGLRGLTFIVSYRIAGDRKARMRSLGSWPEVHPDRAREEAREIRAAARQGRDLLAERLAAAAEARSASLPVSDLLGEWMADLGRQIEDRTAEGRSVLYERELLRLARKIVLPALGGATVREVGGERLQALIGVQTSLSTARNLRNLLARFTRFSNDRFVLRGIPVRWPTRFEVNGRPRSRDHRYTLEEMRRLWDAAGGLGRRGALLRFMMLTGCRRIEAQKVEWDHLRLDEARWEQPGHLTKNSKPHRVPLSGPAIALLRWLPPRVGCPLVFPGRGGKTVGGWTDVRRALLERAGVDGGTLHDFRRTIVSALGDHGFDPQAADKLLNHAAGATMGSVMGVYQRSALWQPQVEAIETWTRLLLPDGARFDEPFAEARIRRPGGRAAARAGSTSPRPRGRSRRTSPSASSAVPSPPPPASSGAGR